MQARPPNPQFWGSLADRVVGRFVAGSANARRRSPGYGPPAQFWGARGMPPATCAVNPGPTQGCFSYSGLLLTPGEPEGCMLKAESGTAIQPIQHVAVRQSGAGPEGLGWAVV